MVVLDNFNKIGWTSPSKNRNAKMIKQSFQNVLISSNKRLIVIENDRRKDCYNSIFFQKFPDENIIKHYSRNTSLGAVFAESFNRSIRDLLKRPVFERRESSLIDIKPTKTKQCKNRIHSSTKLTPTEASLT